MSTEKKCIQVYNKRYAKGDYAGKKEVSVVDLAAEYGVSQSSIRNWLKKAIELGAEKTKVPKRAEAKESTTKKAGGGLTIDQIGAIQTAVANGKSKLSLAKEYGVSRYQIDQAVKAEVKEHKNDVVSVGSELVSINDMHVGQVVVVDKSEKPWVVVGYSMSEDGQTVVGLNVVQWDKYRDTIIPFDAKVETLLEQEYRVVQNCEKVQFAYDACCRMRDLVQFGKQNKFKMVITYGKRSGNVDDQTETEVEYTFDEDGFDLLEELAVFYTTDGKAINYWTITSCDAPQPERDLEVKRPDNNTDSHTKKSVSAEAPSQMMVTPNQIKVVVGSKVLTTSKGNRNFEKCAKAIENADWEALYDAIDMPASVTKFSEGLFTIESGTVKFEGMAVEHAGFCERVLTLAEEGNREQLEYAAKFINRMMDNPSHRVTSRILDFMKFADIEFTEDGCLYAYKAVRSDYLDCHSRSISNTVGSVVEMRRNRVNENDNQTCSFGLHVCSLSYLPHYSGTHGATNRILRVKLSPADIVSIPTDYKDAKIRCCRYEVVADVTTEYRQGKLKIDREGVFSI